MGAMFKLQALVDIFLGVIDIKETICTMFYIASRMDNVDQTTLVIATLAVTVAIVTMKLMHLKGKIHLIGDKGGGTISVMGPDSDGIVYGDAGGVGKSGSGTQDIYRAVGVEEYEDIMSTGRFRGIEGKTLAAKGFGNDFYETLEFANKSINKDKVAIIKVTIPQSVYDQLNYMNLDASIFKSGTPVVEPDMLDFFNDSITNIEHFY